MQTLKSTKKELILKDSESVIFDEEDSSRNWRNADGRRVSEQSVFEWITNALADKENTFELIVGSDSQRLGKKIRFITVVAIYKVGKGGNYFFFDEYEPSENYQGVSQKNKKSKGNQKLRMFAEVERSIKVAELVFEKFNVVPEVHIDASTPQKKEFTSQFSEELTGYVKSSGFESKLKPESWVANAVANRHTKK